MDGERYVGERRALRHFLQELRPLVVAALGEDALLRYRIDRGLQTGDLGTAPGARDVPPSARGSEAPADARHLRAPTSSRARAICSSATARAGAVRPLRRLSGGDLGGGRTVGRARARLSDDVPVRVLISPGTLPAARPERCARSRLDRARSPAAVGAALAGGGPGAGSRLRPIASRPRLRTLRATVPIKPDLPTPDHIQRVRPGPGAAPSGCSCSCSQAAS